jgi:hypothetical protein
MHVVRWHQLSLAIPTTTGTTEMANKSTIGRILQKPFIMDFLNGMRLDAIKRRQLNIARRKTIPFVEAISDAVSFFYGDFLSSKTCHWLADHGCDIEDFSMGRSLELRGTSVADVIGNRHLAPVWVRHIAAQTPVIVSTFSREDIDPNRAMQANTKVRGGHQFHLRTARPRDDRSELGDQVFGVGGVGHFGYSTQLKS